MSEETEKSEAELRAHFEEALSYLLTLLKIDMQNLGKGVQKATEWHEGAIRALIAHLTKDRDEWKELYDEAQREIQDWRDRG